MNRSEFLKTSLAALVVASIPSHVLLAEARPKAVCRLYDDEENLVAESPIEFFYDEANQQINIKDIRFGSLLHNKPIQTICIRVNGLPDMKHRIRPIMTDGQDFIITQASFYA